MSDETSPADRIPATIGRYQITGTLGVGAMGAVYKAFDPLIKRTLAIKTIRLDVPQGSPQRHAFIERFYQEARISGTLSHPNIVTLFDIGEEGGSPFLAMEFIDGRTIGSFIEEGTRFKPERVIVLVSQVAAALDYAHSRGVVHRDIKPSNLMIHDGDKVKVTDFGIAKLANADITHSGALLGTPSYMSPEQAMGERLDGRSDIFSLGVCAFEMLSGEQPFPGSNVTAILYKLVHVDPVEPIDLEANGLIPNKWREVFHKVLAKKPAERYQTASEFVRDLEYCLGSWFTGLGDETISLKAPAAVEATAILAVPDPGPRPGTPAPQEPETVLLSPPAGAPRRAGAAESDDAPATILIRPEAAAEKPADAAPPAGTDDESERTTLMPPVAPADDAAAATVLMAAPAAPGAIPAAGAPPPTGAMPMSDTAEFRAPVEVATVRHDVASTEALPTPRPSRPGPPVGLILAGVAAIVVVGLGLVGLLLWSHLRSTPQATQAPAQAVAAASAPATAAPPPAAVETPAPASGSLRVESDPSGARVRVNGEARGRTPLELADLPLGEYEVRLDQRGYDGQSRRMTIDAASPSAQWRATLARSAPVSGAAEIVSTPPGAAVTIDGKPVGRTPLSARALAPGSRSVHLALEGHEPWTGSFDVVAGKTGRVEVRLKPLAARPTPTPEVVDPNHVYADSEVDVKARRLSGRSPSYPDRAPRLRSGERVSVLLQFVVSESGAVEDVKVLESGGKAIDDAVVSAVRTWRYEPATKHGTKVKSRTAFKQTFLGG